MRWALLAVTIVFAVCCAPIESEQGAVVPGYLGTSRHSGHAIPLGRAKQYVSRLSWPIKNAKISSPFGPRSSSFHEGVDFSAPEGTPIFAAHSGKVVFSGRGLRGFGRVIVLEGDGLATVYAHASSTLVDAGDYVDTGDTIARVGESGDATGPHLHFEIRIKDSQGRYVAVSPSAFFP
jgi:murein DD-endopeptidase MepM/ murein hydrolase activator NlpD